MKTDVEDYPAVGSSVIYNCGCESCEYTPIRGVVQVQNNNQYVIHTSGGGLISIFEWWYREHSSLEVIMDPNDILKEIL